MASSSKVMLLGAVAGGGLLLVLLASKKSPAAASVAPPGAPRLPPDPSDPHAQYQADLAAQMQRQEAARAAAAAADPHARYQAEMAQQLGEQAPPVSPELLAAADPHAQYQAESSIPLQPVTPAQPIRTFDIPEPKIPPIDVQAERANVVGPVVSTPAAVPSSAKRSDKAAAQELLAYVTPILKAKRGAELGTKGTPNSFVKAAQVDMGVSPDGIYGPETRTRGKQLLGVTFPARV